MQLSGKEVFDFLQGEWQVSRSIELLNSKKKYEVTGRAVFHVEHDYPDVLLYEEKVHIESVGIESARSYKYKYNKKSQKISKYFSDDKLFYHLEISKNAVSGYHLCLQDEYKSAYHFVDNNKFTIIYDVQGPKKSYSISTEYSRLI